MALFLGVCIYDLYYARSLPTSVLTTLVTILVLYVLSILGSCLYTGMHSLDVFVSIILRIIG